MKRRVLLITLLFALASFGVAHGAVLFSDDFEDGLGNHWIHPGDRASPGGWEVNVEDGNHILQATDASWSGITVDGVGSLKEHDELWAICKVRGDEATADEGPELGLLCNPDAINGNWYLTFRHGGNVGIDECSIAWHALVPCDANWDEWNYFKIAVFDDTLHGKVWFVDEDEPKDWLTSTPLTSHIDEDGVGIATGGVKASFDELVVADGEEEG